MSAFRELGDARYVSLETFRKNGTGVKTPVWAAPLGDELVVFTIRDSYKVKRLRRNPAVRIARCTMRGDILGDWHDGSGRVVDDQATEKAAYRALRKKYTWQMWLADVGGKLGGRAKKRAILAFSLGDQ